VRRATLRRAAALWLLLFGVYAATIGLDGDREADYPGDEAHYLLTAKSIVEDGSPDVLDEYRARDYGEIYPYNLQPHGALTKGMLNEPHGIGFPLLIAPAYAVAGPKGVELFLAAVAALAMALAYALALRVVPDPWAIGATILAGLSPPMLAWSTAVYPAIAAGAALAGAVLLTLKLTTRRSRPMVFGCFALIGMLPWLAPAFLLPAAVVAALTARLLWTQHRRMLAIGGLEVLGFSIAFYAGLNDGLFGGLTPYAAQAPGETATGASGAVGYLDRAYRVVGLWIDREYGLLRWAPLFLLAWVGLWFVWREWRGGLARVIPELQAEELAAALFASVIGAQLVVAVFLAPTMSGFWFPARHLIPALPMMIPLVAIGLRRMPRLGAVLGAIGVVASVWLYVDVRWGDGTLARARPDAPWGPLERGWPRFGDAVLPDVLALVIALAVAAAFFVDAHVWRRLAGRGRVGAGASVLLAAVIVAGALAAPGTARAERVKVGESREGRAIVASRLGDPASPRKVVVVGLIHGDEPAGLAVTRTIRRTWAPRLRGVDLWVIDTFNPDGLRRRTRQNARGVDLNRNFPYRWRANGRRGSRYWGGTKPLSEPESRAVRRLVLRLKPAVTIWYHQPWGAVLSCGAGRSTAIPRRYARLAGMRTSCRGNDLTGTAASWQNHDVGGTAFVVELPPGRVGDGLIRSNARAAALVAQGE
jgi:hypothetical protein